MPVDFLPLILVVAILLCSVVALFPRKKTDRLSKVRIVCLMGIFVSAALLFFVYLLPGIRLFPMASKGDVNSQIELGEWYQAGMNTGLFEWPNRAAKWYRKAADQGNAHAQYQMGIYYYEGGGVSKDDAMAIDWFEKAATNGMPEAAKMVALIKRSQP